MPAPPAHIGPFPILEKLGEGGMGVVFLVQDPNTPRRLALKLIRDQAAGEIAVERFWREAEALARVHHRSVVRVHQIGQLQEGTYLLMEPIEGESLDSLLRRGALKPKESARIIRELADAVAAVHAQEILHRDLKPGNVILQPDGIPVLLDFGLIRDASAERLTKTGATLGTLAYMSPEQTGGESTTLLGPQTDVYSLGVILFELVTGLRPFEEASTAQLIAHRLYDEAPLPSSVEKGVPRAIDAICSKALAREPERRYSSAEALREDLDRFLAGRPPVALEHLGSGRRGLGLVVALLLTLVLAAVGIFALKERKDDPAELEAIAERLAKDARRMLADKTALVPRAARVEALSSQLRALESALSPELEGTEATVRAHQQVIALGGLLALARGAEPAAREALATLQSERSEFPALHALRGGLAAVTTASDPSEATRDLSRALSRGIRSAELLGWRARALIRTGLSPVRAEDALKDLEALAAERALTSEEQVLRVLALAGTKRADAAISALKSLPNPALPARWAVALLQVELCLETNPAAALGFLNLPQEDSPAAERARLAKRAIELATPLAARVGGHHDNSAEDKLLAYARLIKRLQPNEEIPDHLVKAMVEACTRWRNGRFWNPGEVQILSSLIPADAAELHERLGMMALNLRSSGERKPLIPVLRRAVALQTELQVRRDLEVALCAALAQTGQTEESMSMANRLLERLDANPVLRADVLGARADAFRQRGDLEEALVDIEAALAIARHGRWTRLGFDYRRAKILQALGRNVEAALDAAEFVEHTAQFNDEEQQRDALIIAWTHGATGAGAAKVRVAIERAIERGYGSAGWNIRLATLLLRAGDDVPAAVTWLRRAAPDLEGDAAGLAKETTAVADAVEGEGAAALPKLEALLEKLETLRGEGFAP